MQTYRFANHSRSQPKTAYPNSHYNVPKFWTMDSD